MWSNLWGHISWKKTISFIVCVFTREEEDFPMWQLQTSVMWLLFPLGPGEGEGDDLSPAIAYVVCVYVGEVFRTIWNVITMFTLITMWFHTSNSVNKKSNKIGWCSMKRMEWGIWGLRGRRTMMRFLSTVDKALFCIIAVARAISSCVAGWSMG